MNPKCGLRHTQTIRTRLTHVGHLVNKWAFVNKWDFVDKWAFVVCSTVLSLHHIPTAFMSQSQSQKEEIQILFEIYFS
jgi:hypothetical protein